jgi:hypothetical protein
MDALTASLREEIMRLRANLVSLSEYLLFPCLDFSSLLPNSDSSLKSIYLCKETLIFHHSHET